MVFLCEDPLPSSNGVQRNSETFIFMVYQEVINEKMGHRLTN